VTREDLARLADELGAHADLDTLQLADELALRSSVSALYDAMRRTVLQLRAVPRWRPLRRRRLLGRLDAWQELADAYLLRLHEHQAAWREEKGR
jgi:hypothetical protein